MRNAMAWIAVLGAILMSSKVAHAADNEGMQRLLERGRTIKQIAVCGDVKRQAETGARDAKDLALVQEGAKANVLPCLILLGRWNERGEGVPQDLEQAKVLYGRAAALDPKGYVELGRMAEQGVAGPVSYAQAASYYKQAADKENAGGLLALGRMAEQGLGRTPDIREAVDFYVRAARRWDETAWSNLDRIQSARAVMSAEEASLQQRHWKSLLGVRAETALDSSHAIDAYKDFPYAVILHFTFKRGENLPSSVSIKNPSKSAEFDLALQKALTAVHMPPAPVFGDGAVFETDLAMRFTAEVEPVSQKK